MLLLLDRLIPPTAREKLAVCYYRYRGGGGIESINEVCQMVRDTGYNSFLGVKPQRYPVDYFKRFPIDKVLCETLINQLKDDDIYQHLQSFPSPEHRSVALSNQASIIFVLLSFCPQILVKERAKMREIVDKHFPDNWVIPIYQGYLIDLNDYWNDFDAARRAIDGKDLSAARGP